VYNTKDYKESQEGSRLYIQQFITKEREKKKVASEKRRKMLNQVQHDKEGDRNYKGEGRHRGLP